MLVTGLVATVIRQVPLLCKEADSYTTTRHPSVIRSLYIQIISLVSQDKKQTFRRASRSRRFIGTIPEVDLHGIASTTTIMIHDQMEGVSIDAGYSLSTFKG